MSKTHVEEMLALAKEGFSVPQIADMLGHTRGDVIVVLKDDLIKKLCELHKEELYDERLNMLEQVIEMVAAREMPADVVAAIFRISEDDAQKALDEYYGEYDDLSGVLF